MKNIFQTGLIIIGMLAGLGCASQSEVSMLKAENKNLMDQIDTLNEKLTIMTVDENLAMQEKNKQIADLNDTYSNVLVELSAEKAAGILKVSLSKNFINIEFLDKVFFDSGSEEIKSAGKATLDKLVKVLKTVKNKMIRVEGYTDDVPIADSYKWKYPSNWELSTARATSIIWYLQDKDISPKILKAIGYGRYNPEASNKTEEGRARNRRIVVQLLPLDVLEQLR